MTCPYPLDAFTERATEGCIQAGEWILESASGNLYYIQTADTDSIVYTIIFSNQSAIKDCNWVSSLPFFDPEDRVVPELLKQVSRCL